MTAADPPDITPLCEACGEPKTRRQTESRPAEWEDWICRPCYNEGQRLAYHARKSTEDETVPLCEFCGSRKRRIFGDGAVRSYWYCSECKSKRAREHYYAMRHPEVAERPAEPEKPLKACWRESRDYWSAWKNITSMEKTYGVS